MNTSIEIRQLLYERTSLTPYFNPIEWNNESAQGPIVVDVTMHPNEIMALYGPDAPLSAVATDAAAFVVETEALASVLRQITKKLVVVCPYGYPHIHNRETGFNIGILNGSSVFKAGNLQAQNIKLLNRLSETYQVWGDPINLNDEIDQIVYDDLLAFAANTDVLVMPAPQGQPIELAVPLTILAAGTAILTTSEYYVLSQCSAVQVLSDRYLRTWQTNLKRLESNRQILDKMFQFAKRHVEAINSQSISIVIKLEARLRRQ